MPATKTILCFGELLWDNLPHGRFPGGAPFNVAYHLNQHDHDTLLVSAVGDDPLGQELLQHLANWDIPTGGIARHRHRPTGTVTAAIGPSGDAHYSIASDVAWDEIIVDHAILTAATRAHALIFGSLALRSPANQFALSRLLGALSPAAWRVFDVNLRAPHDDPELVLRHARDVRLLKLNAAEAARLAHGAAESPGREEADARALAADTGAGAVCVTAGERGAGLLRNNQWTWVTSPRIAVVDTIGAGDAFMASLVGGLISGDRTDEACLAEACRLGSWVASRPGATPEYQPVPRSAVA